MKQTSRPPILCISVTPAIQRTLQLARFFRKGVNRAVHVAVTSAGKGVNVARALHGLRAPSLLAGFAGDNGLEEMLDAEGLHYCHVRVPFPTRTCTTIIESDGAVTELVEEAVSPTSAAWRELEQLIARLLPRCSMVVAAGRLPPRAPDDFYARIAGRAARARVPMILDAPGKAMRLALRGPLLMAKMNDEEFAALGADALCEMRAENFFITAGARRARWIRAGFEMEFPVAKIRAVNTIGCGDATSAGIAHALTKGHTMEEAIRFGMACGTANALTLQPGEIRRADLARLAKKS